MNLTQGLHRVQEPVHDGRVQRESGRVPGGADAPAQLAHAAQAALDRGDAGEAAQVRESEAGGARDEDRAGEEQRGRGQAQSE